MALALLFLSVGRVGAAQLPSGVVTDGVGVSIHFYGGGSGDLNMIKAAGCNVVRMDCTWDQIETTAGQYNFGLPDQLYYDAEPRGIRPMFILDYGNSLYGTDYTSTAWQQGFANFAAAAAAHYKGSNVIWEIWNEPNSGSMDATTYTNLVKLAAPAMRAADPNTTIIGPALGGVGTNPQTYLKTCVQQGLLNYVDAVSVHPYNSGAAPKRLRPPIRVSVRLSAQPSRSCLRNVGGPPRNL